MLIQENTVKLENRYNSGVFKNTRIHDLLSLEENVVSIFCHYLPPPSFAIFFLLYAVIVIKAKMQFQNSLMPFIVVRTRLFISTYISPSKRSQR